MTGKSLITGKRLRLCAALALALLACAFAPATARAGNFTALQALLNENESVTLTEDYTAEENESALSLTRSVTLDLNGHTIDSAGRATGTVAESPESSVTVLVTGGHVLTLTDSTAAPGNGGAVTGGAYGVCVNGGTLTLNGAARIVGYVHDGVIVESGIFTMNGGTIDGSLRTDERPDGVHVFGAGAQFFLHGGTISGNRNDQSGGGVCVSNGTFTMDGGTITGNYYQGESTGGGGVYVSGGATFLMSGGEITGNGAKLRGGGVYLADGAAFRVSGDATVTGNTTGQNPGTAGDPASNVYLRAGQTVAVSGALTGCVGVTAAEPPAVIAEPAGVQNGYEVLSDSDAARFTSDDAAYETVKNSDGNVELASAWSVLQSKLDAGGTVTLQKDYRATAGDAALTVSSGSVTLDLNGHVLDRGLTEAASGGCVIKVTSTYGTPTTLTLTDGSPSAAHTGNYAGLPAGGVVTGGFNAAAHNYGGGGGVYVEYADTTFNMTGGTIYACRASHDGGGVFALSARLGLNGGAISGCEAENGAGVYLTSGGSSAYTLSGIEISGNTASGNGGGAYIACVNTEEVTLDGGAITGNTAAGNGGGVYIGGGGLVVTDGTISENSAAHGGGVYNAAVSSHAVVAMSGGAVTRNTATYTGGGVYVGVTDERENGGGYYTGSLRMTNGAINENTAGESGGGVYVEGAFSVAGGAAVNGNKLSDDTTASNVYLPADALIRVSGALTGTTPVGVTMAESGAFTDGWGSAMGEAELKDRFSADESGFLVLLGDGEAVLAPKCGVTLHVNGGALAEGKNVTEYGAGFGAALPAAADIARTGYTFGGWFDNEGLTGTAITAIGTDASGDKEYWAKWTLTPYAVTVAETDGGTVTPDKTTATMNETVTLTVTPDAAHALDTLSVADADGNPVAVADNAFTMPAANVTVTATFRALDQVAAPTFTPAAGTYRETQRVTISCATEGAVVRYTTDGTEPTASSPVCDAPIEVAQSLTVKAIAVKEGMTNSAVASAAYVIEPPPAGIAWTLQDGVLTVTGVGEIADCARGGAPWFARRAEIASVVIGEGVTRVGNYAFYACGAVRSVTLGASVTELGQRAFAYCTGLSSVTGGALANVGEGAFYACFRLTERGFAGGAALGAKAFELCGLGG